MSTLLIAEHNNQSLSESTIKSATAAVQMGGDVHVLVAGAGCAAVADRHRLCAGAGCAAHADAAIAT